MMCESCLKKNVEINTLAEEVRQLKVALYGRGYEPPGVLGLTPSETAMLRVLVSHDRPSQDWLLFDATRENGGPRYVASIPALVKVHLCKLRRKMSAFGWEIENVRGVGYRLTPETRRALLNWTAERVAA